MLKIVDPVESDRLWQQLVEAESEYIRLRMRFLADCSDRTSLIRQALQSPLQRGTALRAFDYLSLEERQTLFLPLLDLVSVSHSDLELCRQALLALPKPWLLARIESAAAELLQTASDEEYRRLLEFYLLIDRALAQRLATQALQHLDPDIQEVGLEFDQHLRQTPLLLAM